MQCYIQYLDRVWGWSSSYKLLTTSLVEKVLGFVKFAWQSSQFVIITIAMGISVSKSKVKIVLFHFPNKISNDIPEKCDKTERREVVH